MSTAYIDDVDDGYSATECPPTPKKKVYVYELAGADPAGGLRGSEPLPNDKGRSCAEGAEAPISILFR